MDKKLIFVRCLGVGINFACLYLKAAENKDDGWYTMHYLNKNKLSAILLVVANFLPLQIQAQTSNILSCQSVFSISKEDTSYLSFDQFKDVRPFATNSGTATILKAQIKGEKVIIKYRSFDGYTKEMEALKAEQVRSARVSLIKEAQWLRKLNAQRIGASLVGFTSVGNHLALVIKEVAEPHILIKAPYLASEIKNISLEIKSQGFRASPETISEFERVAKVLSDNAILPIDIQFLLTASGKLILIDPEHFVQLPNNSQQKVQLNEELQSFLQLLKELQ